MNIRIELLKALDTGLPVFGLALLIVLPGFTGPYVVHLLTLALTFGIFALAYDILLGHTGIVSFGHSIFYGMPAYVIGMMGSSVLHITNPFVLLSAALVTGVLLGAAVGWICTYSRGIYLAIVTFAVAQIVALIILSDPGGLTFGDNGIVGVRPPALTFAGLQLNLFSGVGLYYLTLAFLVAVYLGIRLLARSQWGQVFHAIRENEDRLPSLGYNPRPYKVLAFALSGGVSGIAGSMAAFLNNTISPEMVNWQVSAEILLITVLGGAGTHSGPVLGAFAVVLTEAVASSLLGGGNWVYVLGGLYIAVAMFPSGGIMAMLSRLMVVFQRGWTRVAVLRAGGAKVDT
jgi:branched-chain amino acid transport system permease protein